MYDDHDGIPHVKFSDNKSLKQRRCLCVCVCVVCVILLVGRWLRVVIVISTVKAVRLFEDTTTQAYKER